MDRSGSLTGRLMRKNGESGGTAGEISADRGEELAADAELRGFLPEGDFEEVATALDPDDPVFAGLTERLATAGVDIREEDASLADTGDEPVAAPAPGADSDLIRIYLDEIGRYPLLTPDEEFSLATLTREGDGDARKLLILSNLRLVVSLASNRRYQNRGLDLLDLFQEGNLGLIRAVDRFRPEKGYRLSTYAGYWIHQSVVRALASQGRAIRLPVHVVQKIWRYSGELRRLESELGRAPSEEDIARAMGEDLAKVRVLARLVSGLHSLDSPGSRESLNWHPELTDDQETSPERLLDRQLQHLRVHELLDRLQQVNDRDAMVLRLRYGMEWGGDGEVRTLEEVAKRLHEMGYGGDPSDPEKPVSRERIRQIEARALAELRRLILEAEEGLPEA